MTCIYNGKLVEELVLSPQDRGLLYGDGLFETFIGASLPDQHYRWGLHLDRLKQGLDLLNLDWPDHLPQAPEGLAQLASSLAPDGQSVYRFRLNIWRAEGGLYTPLHSRTNWLLVAYSYTAPPLTAGLYGIAQSVSLQLTPVSNCKTMSALPYVLANQERVANNWDEILITNADGRIIEASAGNLFMIDAGGNLVTPPLADGCIGGVTRKLITEHHNCQYYSPLPEELDQYQCLFTTNVAGVRQLGNAHTHPVIQAIRSRFTPYQLG